MFCGGVRQTFHHSALVCAKPIIPVSIWKSLYLAAAAVSLQSNSAFSDHTYICWFEKWSCVQTTHQVNTPGPPPQTLFLLPSFDINCLMLKHGSDYHQGLLVQFVRNKCCKKKIIIKGCSINRGWLLFSWLFLARWLAALVDHPPSTPVMMSAWS